MLRILFIIILFLFGACATIPEPNSRLLKAKTQLAAEDLARLEFSHGGFDNLIDQMTATILIVMRPALESELKREMSRTENDVLTATIRRVLVELYPEEEWIKAVSDIYYRYFTIGEMEYILQFYSTPTGKHLINKQQTIFTEAVTMGERMFEKKQDQFAKRLQEELEKKLPSITSDLSTKFKDSSELNISDTIQACRNIQDSPEIPIGCEFDYLEGKPSIYVTFNNLEAAQPYIDDMATYVIAPFCHAANSVNRHSLVFIILSESDLINMFLCESGDWSGWYSINKDNEL